MFPPELNSEFETEHGAGHPDATRPGPAEYSNFNRQTQTDSDLAEARRQQEHFYHAALNEVTLGLMKRQEPGPLLKTIVEKAARLVGTRLAYVSLVDPTNSFLELKVKLDDEVNDLEYFQTMKKGEGLAGLVWKQNRTIVLDNYSIWAERLQRPIYENLRATINLPLRAGDQVLGVLGLGHLTEDKKFTEAEIELLTRFAELASIALDNAQLYSRAQQEIAER